MIKLCTIDLDGTLFNNEKKISEENKEAIRKAMQLGCKIVIASGRPIHGIVPVLAELNLFQNDDYVISYNGAKVFHTLSGQAIYDSTISGAVVKEIYSESRRLHTFFHAFRKNEQLITSQANPYTDIEKNINHIDYQLTDFEKINDEDEFLKCMMVDREDHITDAMKELNPKYYEKYSVVRSSSVFLEFLNKDTNKGNALIALAKYLHIDLKDTMAIGDAGNDLRMIQVAGVGVAMGNAFEEIKKAADYVTASNTESGVAKAIQKFIIEPR